MIKFAQILSICIFLSGCGQMGALYLPEEATGAPQNNKATTAHE